MAGETNKQLFWIFAIAAVLTSACSNNIIYNEAEAMPGNTWTLDNTPQFSVAVKDTIHSNDISFTIRTGSAYPFRNIYLFVTTTSPDGRSITDTLQYNLTDEKGKRYGNGVGDIRELTLPYKLNVYFPVGGVYSVKVQHGMRILDLGGVYDFGMRIEKTPKK